MPKSVTYALIALVSFTCVCFSGEDNGRPYRFIPKRFDEPIKSLTDALDAGKLEAIAKLDNLIHGNSRSSAALVDGKLVRGNMLDRYPLKKRWKILRDELGDERMKKVEAHALGALTDASENHVKIAAALFLGRTSGTKAAAESLRKLMFRKDGTVQFYSVVALTYLGDEGAGRILTAMIYSGLYSGLMVSEGMRALHAAKYPGFRSTALHVCKADGFDGFAVSAALPLISEHKDYLDVLADKLKQNVEDLPSGGPMALKQLAEKTLHHELCWGVFFLGERAGKHQGIRQGLMMRAESGNRNYYLGALNAIEKTLKDKALLEQLQKKTEDNEKKMAIGRAIRRLERGK